MKKIVDLRFVIGVFFVTIGVLLVVYHYAVTVNEELSITVNIRSGLLYFLFGLIMIGLSYLDKPSAKS